ncbi:MAG: hypothetical protein SFY56_09475 [Bacteroidota bacterium]|nr:hypothetical protein [Bacteroidota bacterium]
MRAFLLPFSHDEAATFFFYVQSNNYLPYSAHVYTNNHVLNSALANICYHLFGSHRFILRLPNILAFLILCFGVFKHFKYLKNYASKIMLISFFLLTYNFLDFFELCRGYGLSFGLMTLGMAYLLDYFETKKIKYFLFFSICWQLALVANLILVVVLAILFLYIYIFQIKNKTFIHLKTTLINIANLICLIFWIKFSFFYKEQGRLDYGVGDNYWLVTFKTLILFLFGTEALGIHLLFIAGFVLISVFLIFQLLKNKITLTAFFEKQIVYPILLIGLVIAFYLLKKLVNVNYPEDRTGLFFYLFFVLSFAFFINTLKPKVASTISLLVLFSSLSFFCFSINLKNFSSFYYHTQPKTIYDYLKKEQLNQTEQFTIGGHRVREMNFAFLNYRGNSVLNPMDDSEQMQMNCDYYFALKTEKPYYQLFYDEIMYDEKWSRVLLKRKEKIKHSVFYKTSNLKIIDENAEFFELKKITDTSFVSNNPLEMEIKLTFHEVPKPFHAFLVFSFNDSISNLNSYKRVPLNWLQDDLNTKSKILKLTSSSLPKKIKDLKVYIWNIDKQTIKITINSLTLYQLHGKGVNVRVPEKYYQLVESITKKPIL